MKQEQIEKKRKEKIQHCRKIKADRGDKTVDPVLVEMLVIVRP